MAMKPDGQEFSQFLRLAFLRSPNYVPAVSGWTINQDGSAEFNNVVIRNGQVVSGTALYYSSLPPALGNLVASVASSSGTDHAGNAFIGPGMFTYVNNVSVWVAVGISDGTVFFLTAPGPGGPWSAQAIISAASVNNGDISIEAGSVGNVTIGAGTGGSIIGQSPVNVEGNINNATILTVSNLLNTNGGKALVELITGTAPATDRALAVQAAADTNNRFRIDTSGQHNWGTGAATPDTTLYRGAAKQLATAGLVADKAGTPESWQAPTFANGWLNNAAVPVGPALQYRLEAAPYNSVRWVGRLLAPGGIVANQAVIAPAVVAAYRPNNDQSIMGIDTSTGAAVRFEMATGGVLRYQSGAIAGDIIDIPSQLVSLDA